jgi:hypothetical protein
VPEQPAAGGSTVLIDEYFASGDDRFLAEVFASRSDKKLLSLAEPWFWDPRPFARRMVLAYVDDGCDRLNHRPLVKRLFKAAEAAADDELMGHFLVAFDRLVHRELVEKRRYDWQSRTTHSEWVLARDPQVLAGVPKPQPGRRAPKIERFTTRTRQYLCRRAFRYFRNLGRREPERYGRAMRAALLLYRDANLQKPQQLLDAWGLVNALYHGSPVLVRHPRGVRLASGARLADLAPAPLYPEAWRDFDGVLTLVERAESRTVRRFAIDFLEREHADSLRGLPFPRLRNLLGSPHEEVQRFAAARLADAEGLDNLPLADWLEILKVENAEVVPLLCDLVRAHVHPDRLSLAQCVELARSAVAAVAELGLQWAQAKPVAGRDALETVVGLRETQVGSVRAAAMDWLAGLLTEAPETSVEMVRDLVDARHREARAAGLTLLEARFPGETRLWVALSESPYDEVRSRFLADLRTWESALEPTSLRRVWVTTLLAIHRGGPAKRLVVRQVAERIVARPDEADELLPLLAIALRSVRVTERRAGLAAVARAAFREPALRAALARRLPELHLDPTAATAAADSA